MEIIIPKDVKDIIDEIYINKHEAYIVGGCVRDSIIGLKPNDYDITSSAKPEEILSIFKKEKIIETGIDHGTVTLIKNNEEYEITTYRIDGEYNDNRRPDYVEFTKDISKDLQRRDFTINSMAYNHKYGLVDEFGGIKDIEQKIIRTVGIADDRFNEDSLRIIRAVRFSAKLDFEIEKKTLESIYKNMYLINNISVERIQQELNKILISDNPERIYTLYKAGMFKYLGLSNTNLTKTDFLKLKKSKNNLYIRLTLLIYLILNKNTDILTTLKYSNKIKDKCSVLIKNIDENIKNDKLNIKIYLNKIGKDNLNEVIYLKSIIDEKTYEDQVEIYKNIKHIHLNKECYTLKELNLNGKDLKDLGYQGKEIGGKLNYLLNEVMKDSDKNKKEVLIKILKNV